MAGHALIPLLCAALVDAVDPCGDAFVLGEPQLPVVRVRLPGGKHLTVSRRKDSFVGVRLNGRPQTRTVTYADGATAPDHPNSPR